MKTILIKAGGSILHKEEQVNALCADIKILQESGCQVLLVHGGGKAITDALHAQAIPSGFVDGLRVTSATAMTIIKKVLCSQVNPLLVQKLTQSGLKAVGLSGADHDLLLCDYYSAEHGLVGRIETVNHAFLQQLLTAGQLPVIAPIGVDKKGQALNINADLAACHIANAMAVQQVIYLTDQDGIYDREGTPFAQLSADNLQNLIADATVSGGMLVKVKAVLSSLKAGLERIMIVNGNQKHILADVILNEKKLGTQCY